VLLASALLSALLAVQATICTEVLVFCLQVQHVQQGAHIVGAPLSVLLAVQATIYMKVLVFRLVQVEHTHLIQHVQRAQQGAHLVVAQLAVVLAV